MKTLPILSAAVLVLAASAARAEGPVGPQEEDLQNELAKASLRVSKALKDNEDALAKIARGESAEMKPVDIDLPKKDSKGESKDSKSESSKSESSSSSSSSEGGGSGGEGGGSGGALRGSEEHGKGVVEGIDELLKVAAKMSKGQGSGGGGKSSRPSEGDDQNDSGKNNKGEKKNPDPKGDPLKDNKPEGDKPENGEKSKSQPNKKGQVPPSTPRRPTAQELKGVFLAKLPDKVREAVENGDFDQVPEKYRDLIREWTKALSEADKAEAGGADDAK